MFDLLLEVGADLAGECLFEGVMETAIGGICRIETLRRVFGYSAYVEPKPVLSDEDLPQMREWDEVDAIQEHYRAEPQYRSGLLMLGLVEPLNETRAKS
jgi:hypothetical protein